MKARGSKNLEVVMEQGIELIEFYRNNPCVAAYDLLGVDFAPVQRVIFEDMWFKNYCISVMGRGCGKTYMLGTLAVLSCLLYPGYRVGLIGPVFRQCFPIIPDSYDTFWTDRGLQTTAVTFYDSIEEGVTKIQSLDDQNIVLNKWMNPKRDCIKIKTDKGYEVSGTMDHKVLVLGKKLNLIYKELNDVIMDDYLVIKKGFNYFGGDNSMPSFDEFEGDWRTKDCKIPVELTPDLAYWMGLLVGDGCVSISKNGRKQRVDFVNEDPELLDYFEKYLLEYFIYDPENIDRRNRRNNTWEIQYFCKKLAQYLLKCGFTKTTALDKKVPDVIKKSSKTNFVAFLQGLFDTDGSVYIQNHKHGYPHCEVSLSTSSLQLAREVHSVLLNLGIISNLGIGTKEAVKKLKHGNKLSKCATGYKVRITGYTSLLGFKNIIGFRCCRKKILLTDYLDKCNLCIGDVSIPNKNDVLISLAEECKLRCNRGSDDAKFFGKLINNLRFGSKSIKLDRAELIVNIINTNNYLNSNNEVSDIYNNFKYIVENGVFFVKIKNISYFKAKSIDIEVENEACYWSNGFISHNSKMIFSEVEKLYAKSSILREACEKKPTRGSDAAYLRFKFTGGMSGSYIEALPLGDGGKIRGSRFYLVCIDELAQVPDKILDMVVRPMGATTLEPMENVRRIERQRKLIELGLATEDDFGEDTVNKMVMTSSGYYKFNHMWRRMRDYWRQMEIDGDDKSKYAVHQIPHWDLPEGFLDQDNIDEARRVMSNMEFRMEYEAHMASESEGFFKASLLEACTLDSDFSVEARGKSDAQYIVGVDPNQAGRTSSCGICIVKLGTINKLVNVLELKKKTTQDITSTVQEICKTYNVLRIFMDKGGGGKAVCDLLEDGYGGYEPLIDRTNKDHEHLQGRHILEMINFNPNWISDANFTTLSLLEDKSLRFPEPPTSTLDLDAVIYERIKILKSQLLNIVITQTSSGLLHFDTPKKGQRKDLYSALILASHGIRMFEKEMNPEPEPVLFSSGLVRKHEPGSQFALVGSSGVGNAVKQDLIGAAVLVKNKK